MMIKRALTAISMLVSGMGISQPIDQNNAAQDPILSAQQAAEIKESCGHLLVGSDEYNQCVEIVSIDFTVLPHNTGGVAGCPGSPKDCQKNAE